MFLDAGYVAEAEICSRETVSQYRAHIDALGLPLSSGCKPDDCCNADCPYYYDCVTPLLAQAIDRETRRVCIRQWARVLSLPSSQRGLHVESPVSELVQLLATVPGTAPWIVRILLAYYNHDQVTVERQVAALFAQKKFKEAKALCEEELVLTEDMNLNCFLLKTLQTLDQIGRYQEAKQDTTAASIS